MSECKSSNKNFELSPIGPTFFDGPGLQTQASKLTNRRTLRATGVNSHYIQDLIFL